MRKETHPLTGTIDEALGEGKVKGGPRCQTKIWNDTCP